MRRIVEGFRHVPGVSCGPTSVRNVLACRGLELTEAMCFGLGAGLGFYFLSSESGLSRTFFGRAMALEQDVCELFGLEWRERREPDPKLAWARVRERVDANQPSVLNTDIQHLPYYETQSSYNGHRIALAGYDLDRGVALVADTERPGLQEVALEALERSRASEAPMYGYHANSWFEVHGEPKRALRDVVPEAVRRAGARMLEDPSGFGGVVGLEMFVADLPRWPSLRDFARCAKEGYYSIEKRGTGGGCFRALFAQFLEEARAVCPELPIARTAHAYRELAWQWGELATAMKLAAKDGAWDGVAEHASQILARERELAASLAALG